MTKVKKFGDGHINETYLLETDNDKVVIQKVNKSYDKVGNIERVANFLEKKEFPSVRVLKNWRVVSFVKGKPIKVKKATNKQLKSAIELVVKFHNIIQDFEVRNGCNPHKKIKEFESLPKRNIHGDMRFDNILFKDDRAIAIIDLDTVTEDYIVWELANIIFMWCGGVSGKPDLKRIQNIKKWYFELEDFWTEKEKNILDSVVKLFSKEKHEQFKNYDYFKKLSKEYCDKRSENAMKFLKKYEKNII